MIASLAAVTIGGHGLVNFLVILLIGCVAAALVHVILRMFAPPPIPLVAALIVLVLAVVIALNGAVIVSGN